MALWVGCSDDDAGSDRVECESWERYNTETGRCEIEQRSADDAGASSDDSGGTTGEDGSTGADDSGTDEHDGGSTTCGAGEIIGTACAPSGERLAGADVTIEGVDCDGDDFRLVTTTDSNGDFDFPQVPSGQHTLSITTGSFDRTQPIIVQDGDTLDLSSSTSKVCLDSSSVEIAVVGGTYDHVSGILDDLELDYTFEGDDQMRGLLGSEPPTAAAFLTNRGRMEQYDIIFINCGVLWGRMEEHSFEREIMVSNLNAYVRSGRSLYVSDWSHPFIEEIFPDAIEFYGDDSQVNDPRIGYAPQTISATVASPQMQNVLGQSTAQIEFPHDGEDIVNNHWVVAEGASDQSTIHLHGDAQLCPNSIDAGGSCSAVGGTQSAAPLLVTYEDPTTSGTVIFTSFHNERQSALNDDMERILKFLIFQL